MSRVKESPTEIQPLRESKWRQQLRRQLLSWYRKNAREMPWRTEISLYRTWISEIMLQQTQVATVISYFERFMQQFPSIPALAEADEDRVLRAWEGLGYYRRARQLHKAAQVMVEEFGGEFPTSFEDVLALPGVGRYTAGAILSIAGGQRQPILEANTIRLFCRLLAYDEDPTTSKAQKVLWQFAEEILPRSNAGELNQALMELGSLVCSPTPACQDCPVARQCETQLHGLQQQIPLRVKKMKYVDVDEMAVVVRDGEKVLLRRCRAEERWAGLWDFPRFAAPTRPSDLSVKQIAHEVQLLTGAKVQMADKLATMKHAVTKYRITLHCHSAVFVTGKLRNDTEYAWVTLGQLAELPLSTTGRKISQLLAEK
ncbi:MAG: A/G-specific adenine glycosylase [Pirellulaceae bacterium]|jgi:A/G-specific adenine glycosylase